MKNLIRMVAALHRVVPGNPARCGGYAIKAISDADALDADVIVLPALSLVGASSGDLMRHTAVLSDCRDALDEIIERTRSCPAYLILGLPIRRSGRVIEATAVLYQGELLELFENGSASPTLFDCGSLHMAVVSADARRLCLHAAQPVQMGAQLIVCTSAVPLTAGAAEESRAAALAFSAATGTAVCVCNGNIGESTYPGVYQAFAGIFECGEQLAWQVHRSSFFTANADIDTDIVSAYTVQDAPTIAGARVIGSHPAREKPGLLRDVRQTPFLPADFSQSVAVTADYFELQVRSLMGRMKNAGIKKIVLGCSGGLDSTLAALVASAALNRMALPSDHLIGVMMPGFGTSDRTHGNSAALLDALGAARREISIRHAATQHFQDIGHDISVHDVTYENAQARERTQILFDLANTEGALVLGTGDLSEAALGWCTFGGDHLASYNVNSSVTKGLVRAIVAYLAQSAQFADVAAILDDILDTPVSPELLPVQEDGRAQNTEEILGPYQLHDFFLYYFVRCRMAPSKIFAYARAAFEQTYSDEFILQTLRTFITRFFGSQFKRSCTPDSAAIGPVSLSPLDYRIPSDASPKNLLEELDASLTE